MIIVQLTGGMGNQLFQYAMGRSLALRNGVNLVLDISYYKTYEWHAYSLAPFAIEESFMPEAEAERVDQKRKQLTNRILRKLGVTDNYIIHEKDLSYNKSYENVKSPAYLVGYWQCEKYFSHYSDHIRKEFTVTRSPSTPNHKLLQQIQSTNAVSLHIRRGNFVNVKIVSQTHGTCSLDYYERSMAYIQERVQDPVFYVFSDDIEWARNNLTGPRKYVFVDVNDAAHDYEDFRLMTSCRYNIMANSTFSWWAAWLNQNSEKIIIAPRRWFADPKKEHEARDLVPATWVRL